MRSVQYLGHSCFLVRLGNVVMLFNPAVADPLSGRLRLAKSALSPRSIRECDLLFLSNEEAANCEPETVREISERCYSSVVAPKPALAKIKVSDRFKIEVKTGDKFAMKGVDIQVMKAVHPQSQYPVGYLVKGDGISVYHAGDTYSFSDIGMVKCDVALVPIGGGGMMDPFAANSAVKEMRPRVAVPMSYNTFEGNQQDPAEFTSDLGGLTKGVALKPGQEIRL